MGTTVGRGEARPHGRITRHGKTIARVAPEGEMRAAEVAEAIEGLKAISRTFGKAPLAEILASRHEGHKY
jgi:antitoxin (DNA-binding transcriptional repressor) of toxin-antitoxin stability system